MRAHTGPPRRCHEVAKTHVVKNDYHLVALSYINLYMIHTFPRLTWLKIEGWYKHINAYMLCMCMCIYIYISVCQCKYCARISCVCVRVRLRMSAYAIHIYIHVYTHTCMHVCTVFSCICIAFWYFVCLCSQIGTLYLNYIFQYITVQCRRVHHITFHCIAVHHWWFQHLWKIWVRQLGWSFPIYEKIKVMFQTINQLVDFPIKTSIYN